MPDGIIIILGIKILSLHKIVESENEKFDGSQSEAIHTQKKSHIGFINKI